MAKLLGDYQYLMKIWTVRFFLFVFYVNDSIFQHPWLLKPHFIDGYYKYLKGQDQVETDQFFQDDPDDIEDDEGGTRTPKRIKNKIVQPVKNPEILEIPQQKISKYFPIIIDDDDDEDGTSTSTDRMGLVMKAIKKEWWYDMFDVDQSQFDVSLITKKNKQLILLFISFRSNFRVNLKYFERF